MRFRFCFHSGNNFYVVLDSPLYPATNHLLDSVRLQNRTIKEGVELTFLKQQDAPKQVLIWAAEILVGLEGLHQMGLFLGI